MVSTQVSENGLDAEWSPLILSPLTNSDAKQIHELRQAAGVRVIDRYRHQLRELIRIREVGRPVSTAGERDLLHRYEEENPGVWVYYPWHKVLVRVLDAEGFARVRTDRNRNKITVEEQAVLAKKRVGIIGMSVGRAVATTMALERTFGTLKIADHDTLDLSNLNRLKAPLYDLGLPKTISVAREIAAIDPFLQIELYNEGITNQNIDSFLLDGGKLDVLIDECDNLEIKILCRQRARELGIPVVMETSDRGMLDIERFDLDPDRPIFHGLLEGIDFGNVNSDPVQRLNVLMSVLDVKKVSERGKSSLAEIGRTLVTWPQLASAVVCGGGVVTDTCRRILLGQIQVSGRFYIDLYDLVK